MRFAAIAASFLLAAGSAAAQGFDWAGVYAGVSLGGASSDVDLRYPGVPGLTGDHQGSGAFLGAQVGNNWALASGLVAGIELDATAGKVESAGPLMLGGVTGEYWPVEIDNQIALRGRIGWVSPSAALVYGALGVSRAKFSGDIYNDLAGTAYRESYSSTANGVTAAIGIEQPVGDRIAVRGEVRHTRYRSESFDLPSTIPHEVKARTTELRVGINWMF